MNVGDRLMAEPLTAVCGCLIWIPLAVWIVSVIHWMVVGDLEVLLGIIALAVGLGLGYMTINPPRPIYSPISFGAAVLTVMLFPSASRAMKSYALARIDLQQLERHYDTFLRQPTNAGALIRIAELLYVRGLAGNALAIGERALPFLPESAFAMEHRMVKEWRARNAKRAVRQFTACLDCGEENNPADLTCKKCGAPYILDLARGRWLGKSTGKKLIAVWIALMLAFVGIPATTSLASISASLALTLIGAQVIAAFIVFFVGFVQVRR